MLSENNLESLQRMLVKPLRKLCMFLCCFYDVYVTNI